MGYYVNITDSTAVIPDKNREEALRRLKAINGPEWDAFKSGGSWRGGTKDEAWWAWLPADYDKTVKTVEDVLELLGFEVEARSDGDDVVIRYYDSKTGSEDFFLWVICDLFEPGSFIRWNGEDGAQWEYFFDGTNMLYRELSWNAGDTGRLAMYPKVQTSGDHRYLVMTTAPDGVVIPDLGIPQI